MSTKYDRLLQEVKDFKTVHGHCKITTKTCPDNDELVAFRKEVRRNYTKYVNNETQKHAYCRLNHSRVEELGHIGIIDSESFHKLLLNSVSNNYVLSKRNMGIRLSHKTMHSMG